MCLSFLFVLNGCPQTTWRQTDGPEGGTIYPLAIDPTNSQTIYADIDENGVYQTTDGGVSWTQMNNGHTNTIVCSLAIAPTNSGVIVYAGTEGNSVFERR